LSARTKINLPSIVADIEYDVLLKDVDTCFSNLGGQNCGEVVTDNWEIASRPDSGKPVFIAATYRHDLVDANRMPGVGGVPKKAVFSSTSAGPTAPE